MKHDDWFWAANPWLRKPKEPLSVKIWLYGAIVTSALVGVYGLARLYFKADEESFGEYEP